MSRRTSKRKSGGHDPMAKTVLVLRELSLPEAKRAAILEALLRCQGNAEAAAELLGMGASTMYRLIGEFEITNEERYPGE